MARRSWVSGTCRALCCGETGDPVLALELPEYRGMVEGVGEHLCSGEVVIEEEPWLYPCRWLCHPRVETWRGKN